MYVVRIFYTLGIWYISVSAMPILAFFCFSLQKKINNNIRKLVFCSCRHINIKQRCYNKLFFFLLMRRTMKKAEFRRENTKCFWHFFFPFGNRIELLQSVKKWEKSIDIFDVSLVWFILFYFHHEWIQMFEYEIVLFSLTSVILMNELHSIYL